MLNGELDLCRTGSDCIGRHLVRKDAFKNTDPDNEVSQRASDILLPGSKRSPVSETVTIIGEVHRVVSRPRVLSRIACHFATAPSSPISMTSYGDRGRYSPLQKICMQVGT